MTEMTSNVSPARIWFVDPNSGQMISPPCPDAPPAPNARNRQQPTATSVDTMPFLSTPIP